MTETYCGAEGCRRVAEIDVRVCADLTRAVCLVDELPGFVADVLEIATAIVGWVAATSAMGYDSSGVVSYHCGVLRVSDNSHPRVHEPQAFSSRFNCFIADSHCLIPRVGVHRLHRH
jgi:hypothetical protein